jgi:hypothetical protein
MNRTKEMGYLEQYLSVDALYDLQFLIFPKNLLNQPFFKIAFHNAVIYAEN